MEKLEAAIRDKLVCSMATSVFFLLMKIMYNRKLKALKWDEDGLVPRVEKIINFYRKKVNGYLIESFGDFIYCVRHFSGEYWIVALNKLTCTCGEWQVT